MRQTTLPIADEIPWADGELFIPDYGGRGSAQYEDALILVVMKVVLGRHMICLDLNDMEAESH